MPGCLRQEDVMLPRDVYFLSLPSFLQSATSYTIGLLLP
jgi:hypothetical protein